MGPKCNRKYKSEAKGDLPHTEEKVLRRGSAVRFDDACLEDWRDAASKPRNVGSLCERKRPRMPPPLEPPESVALPDTLILVQ